MKILIALSLLLVFACKSKEPSDTTVNEMDTVAVDNTRTDKKDTVYTDPSGISPKVYSNERFKDVTVQRTGDSTFVVRGKGQIFEANFNWVVEDGHDEIKRGYTMTNAGGHLNGVISTLLFQQLSAIQTQLFTLSFSKAVQKTEAGNMNCLSCYINIIRSYSH
jgi:hypothetical protein